MINQTTFLNTSKTVSIRGKLFNHNVIELPDTWEAEVDPKTITVNLTPCGASQTIVVKTIDIKQIRLQSNSGLPIECYYHVFAEAK